MTEERRLEEIEKARAKLASYERGGKLWKPEQEMMRKRIARLERKGEGND